MKIKAFVKGKESSCMLSLDVSKDWDESRILTFLKNTYKDMEVIWVKCNGFMIIDRRETK